MKQVELSNAIALFIALLKRLLRKTWSAEFTADVPSIEKCTLNEDGSLQFIINHTQELPKEVIVAFSYQKGSRKQEIKTEFIPRNKDRHIDRLIYQVNIPSAKESLPALLYKANELICEWFNERYQPHDEKQVYGYWDVYDDHIRCYQIPIEESAETKGTIKKAFMDIGSQLAAKPFEEPGEQPLYPGPGNIEINIGKDDSRSYLACTDYDLLALHEQRTHLHIGRDSPPPSLSVSSSQTIGHLVDTTVEKPPHNGIFFDDAVTRLSFNIDEPPEQLDTNQKEHVPLGEGRKAIPHRHPFASLLQRSSSQPDLWSMNERAEVKRKRKESSDDPPVEGQRPIKK